MSLVKLYDEVALLTQLQSSTLKLIHATEMIDAIKKLIEAHDIIVLNLDIGRRFRLLDDSLPLDICALKHLNRLRCELLVFHQTDFTPPKLVHRYSEELLDLFRLINLKEKNNSRRISVG
jgi:hypothetical protein